MRIHKGCDILRRIFRGYQVGNFERGDIPVRYYGCVKEANDFLMIRKISRIENFRDELHPLLSTIGAFCRGQEICKKFQQGLNRKEI